MDHDKDRLSINVAKLYYRSEYSQQKIAEELGISRPSVSRLLQYAKEKGYVKIQIFDPVEDMSHMEEVVVVLPVATYCHNCRRNGCHIPPALHTGDRDTSAAA